jgi:hypothetical protein
MSTKEKSYTFRAAPDLANRTREAFRTWGALLESDDPAAGETLRDAMTSFCLAVGRRARDLETPENQSELFRATFELLVDATERAVRDREAVQAYEEWAQADEEGAAIRKAALGAAADRWRDE